jgi:hypothetical protein
MSRVLLARQAVHMKTVGRLSTVDQAGKAIATVSQRLVLVPIAHRDTNRLKVKYKCV